MEDVALKITGDTAHDVPMEPLLTEGQAIDALGLTDRPNPKGGLRWLVRTKRLGCVRLGRVLRFRPADIRECIDRAYEKAA